MKKVYILLLLIISSLDISAQTLTLSDIDIVDFPLIKAKFKIFDSKGKAINPDILDLKIKENSIERNIKKISCSIDNSPSQISSILTIDIGESMNYHSFDARYIFLAKAGAKHWIELNDFSKSECAITSFDSQNYLNHDFTNEKNRLISAIDNIKLGTGSSITAALDQGRASALEFSKNAKFGKNIILMSDGTDDFDNTSIIAEAKAQNCKIYCIVFGSPIKDDLKSVAMNSGAKYFENVTDSNAVFTSLNLIFQDINNNDKCIIEWQSDFACIEELRNVELKYQKISAFTNYTTNSNTLSVLKATNNNFNFGKRKALVSYDTLINLKAINQEIEITDIKLINGSPCFSIINPPLPFKLLKNQSLQIKLRYTPSDSNLVYANFMIETNTCKNFISASAGFPNKVMKNKTLRIYTPNGGEKFEDQMEIPIRWGGISNLDTVKLEYSSNLGDSWNLITNKAVGLEYKWIDHPKMNNDKMLIRISQYQNLKSEQDTLKHISISNANILASEISQDSRFVYVFLDNKSCEIYETESGKLVTTKKSNYINTRQIKLLKDNSVLINGKNMIYHLDIINNIVENKFISNSNNILDFQISHDEKKLACIYQNNRVKIWDFINNKLIADFDGHNDSIMSLSWSPDDLRLATASRDSSIKIWDLTTNKEFRKLYKNNDYIKYVSWSKENRYLALGYGLGSLNIIDVINMGELAQLNQLAPNQEQIVSWDECSCFFSYLNNPKSIEIRHTGSMMPHRRYNYHSADILDFKWSKNSEYFISIDKNNLYINSQNNEILQSATSFLPFTLIKNDNVYFPVNIGKSYIGEVKDTVFEMFTTLATFKQYVLKKVYFEGKDSEAFSLKSPFVNENLKFRPYYNFEFSFKPKKLGFHTCNLIIISTIDTLKIELNAEAIQSPISVINNLIDFGNVRVNSYKDISKVSTIKNISNQPIKIKNIYISTPNITNFLLLNPKSNFDLQAGDSLELDLRFGPSDYYLTNSTIVIEHESLDKKTVIQMYGKGIDKNKGEILIQNCEANSGDTVEVEIYQVSSIDKSKIDLDSINLNLTFNSTLLEALAPLPQEQLDKQNLLRTVALKFKMTEKANTLLAKYKFRAALGNDSISVLEGRLADSDTADVDLVVRSGEFKLLDLCRAGGARLINPNSQVYLSTMRPNPANDFAELEIETRENGLNELFLLNMNGKKIATFYQSNKAESRQTIKLDFQNIDSGIYYLILKTESSLLFQKIEINH